MRAGTIGFDCLERENLGMANDCTVLKSIEQRSMKNLIRKRGRRG